MIKSNKPLILVMLCSNLTAFVFSQEFVRQEFDYNVLKSITYEKCSDSILIELEKSTSAIQQNNSKAAIENSTKIYDIHQECPDIYRVHGLSLFRNGQWLKGIEIIEEGIKKFGSDPDLIKQRSDMSLEMAQMGTSKKNIDGNTVYKGNSLEYDEDTFIKVNHESALSDLRYLVREYSRPEEVYYVAKILQIMGEYEESNETFSDLINDQQYRSEAIFNIADNHIALNDLDLAEKELQKILIDNSKEGILYSKLADISFLRGDSIQARKYQEESIFHSNIPYFSDLEYSTDNYNLLILFGTDKYSVKDKMDKLNSIYKNENQDFCIDICLTILKLHANHGNGVEERATEILVQIGEPSINKVNELFQYDISTCTVTNLAEVMAEVKNEDSWELMKQYLPYIAHMPMTMIPPSLPEKMILFDEDAAIKEILNVVKPLLTQEVDTSDPMAQMASFGMYVYYAPLKIIKRKKVLRIANELGYGDEEINQLEIKLNK